MNANSGYPRWLKAVVLQDLLVHPVVVVVGARQVGKSTLCSQIADTKGFISTTLDDTRQLEQARRDPERFLDSLGDGPVFIDEAQRVPSLFLAIKARVDQAQRPGHFLLCGSNQPEVRHAVGDSLVGRAVYRHLRPLTLGELRFDETPTAWSFLFEGTDEKVLDELRRRSESHGELDWKVVTQTGGFPRAVAAVADLRLRLLDDYLTVLASRDIQEVIGVDAVDRFESFVRLLATRVAQPLNYSSIASDLGLSVGTVRRWTDALRRSYLVELIEPYSRNAGHRVIKAPKMVFIDCALAQAAAREIEPTGFHLENLIATDLAVWQGAATRRGLYHWRLSTGQEVDFVLEQDGIQMPIEVKASSSINSGDARHLKVFLERHHQTRRGVLLSSDPTIRLLGGGIVAAPWWAAI
jgi:uncharacterized protein